MSVAPIIERTKETLRSGKWWTIPWWRNDKYYKDGFASRESTETAFSELIRTFDAKWVLGQKTGGSPPFLHQIAIQLMAEGLSSFQFLYELGINLYTARVSDLLGDIERRLKNPKEYWEAAAFELKFLSGLIRTGFKVERNYPSGKGRYNCDFKVSKGSETVFVEIKRPRELIAQNQQIINRAHSLFFAKLLNDEIRKEEDFTSAPLSSRAEANKVFRIIRDAAKSQIPEGGPGIIIVESPHALHWSEFALMAEKRFRGRRKYPALSAAILIQILFQDGRIRHSSFNVLNPQASIDIKFFAIIEFFHNMNEVA